jgi:hypothetical protein
MSSVPDRDATMCKKAHKHGHVVTTDDQRKYSNRVWQIITAGLECTFPVALRAGKQADVKSCMLSRAEVPFSGCSWPSHVPGDTLPQQLQHGMP